MNIKQIEAFIKSVNLFNAIISIKRDNTGALLMAELESGGDVIDYVYATDSRFLAKISLWAIENAAGYLPEPKSHANDHYDLVPDTVQAFNERIQEDKLTEYDDSSFCPDTKDVTRILQARIYEALYNGVPTDVNVEMYDDSEDD